MSYLQPPVLLRSILFLTVALTAATRGDERDAARRIIDETGVRGGFVVHLGCGDGKLTAALRMNSSYQVQGLDRRPDNVQKARKLLSRSGDYGRISIDRLVGTELPYIDNLVNLLIADRLEDISMDEVMRVLVPHGVAYIQRDGKWVKTVKPRPTNIDEWSHYYHDAGGNAVAHDDVVGPPRHLQWLGSPRWSRHHDRMASLSAMVSAGGRMFYIMDEGSRVSIQLPPRWTLIARDAFNGTVLWKRRLPTWHSHLWPLKSGPTQLARRLVASKDRVFVTLGFEAPLSILDAASGEVLNTVEGTKTTEEMIHTNGVAVLLVNQKGLQLSKFAPKLNVGDQGRVATEYTWNTVPREIVGVDSQSGKVLWRHETPVAPLTLSADQQNAFFHDGSKVVALDLRSGKISWNSKPAGRREKVPFNFGPKLVVYRDVVLFAGGDRTMRGLRAKDGKELWSAPHARGGYQSPEDLLVSGGMIWSAPTTRGKDTGVFTGRDPLTGKVLKEFPPDVETYWFHHRCYGAKATDKFLLTSRTGIEFINHETKSWDINHWVRGGCLYGIMPCNGLVYAPPHDCACYPEAKLYGLNALAPASKTRQLPSTISEADRLQRGPAFSSPLGPVAGESDWPTFRHDQRRSGRTKHEVPAQLSEAWATKLKGRLSAVVVSGGKLLVAEIDSHTVHALDAKDGKIIWSFVAGGRVDSPPTIWKGRVLFGSADGYVYCLRANDGELAWRFRVAPIDRRLMAFEQLESVWPVHGSVLVRNDIAYFVAGRSSFLDGGMRFFRLDPHTGEKLAEVIIDEKDPGTGKNLQSRLQTLQMPVGLPDVLSSDEKYIYMRSQRFRVAGEREDLGPQSGNASGQGAAQDGVGRHLFSPTGFLDDTWFHRAYWVFGRSFAGGHNGYYQAGKYTPSGRMLVFDDENVYGFSRKPKYYKWTTILEHQLFSASKLPPPITRVDRRGRQVGGASMVRIARSPSLKVTNVPVAVEAWVRAEKREGVVLARGGPSNGFALLVRQGKPRFTARIDGELHTVPGPAPVINKWAHLVGQMTKDKQLQLFVDGKLVGSKKIPKLLPSDPIQAMEIGGDDKGAVGNYKSPFTLTGVIDEVRVYHATLTAEDVKKRFEDSTQAVATKSLVYSSSFEDGKARDASGNRNHGTLSSVRSVQGRVGRGLRFVGGRGGGNRGGGSFVKHHWDKDLPLFVQSMVLANKTLFIAGPPDVMNEEETFKQLTARDPRVTAILDRQDKALNGDNGAILWAVSPSDGRQLGKLKLPAIPVWDGMAAANGRLYLASQDGVVRCYK